MKELNSTTDPIGQNLIKLISNVCFSVFVFSVLIFTVIAITYQPPDPWESSRALTRVFTNVENATFQTDNSVLKTGEDFSISPASSLVESALIPLTEPLIDKSEQKEAISSLRSGGCEDVGVVNCSEPGVLLAIRKFNLKHFKSIAFLEYQTPVNGSKQNECDVAWRFRNRKEKSWRRYRDFRRFRLGFGDNCTYKVVGAKGWHSGLNARRPRSRVNATRSGERSKIAPVFRKHFEREPRRKFSPLPILETRTSLEWFVRRVQDRIVLCTLRRFLVKSASKSRYSFEDLDRDEIIVAHMVGGVDAFIKVPQGWPVSSSVLKLVTLKSSSQYSKEVSLSFLCKVEEIANSLDAHVRQSISSFVDAIEEILVQQKRAELQSDSSEK